MADALKCTHTADRPSSAVETINESRAERLVHSWAFVTAVCLGLWALVRWTFFVGFEGSDDMFYARFAALWHHTPVNQWEVRLLGNAMIRGAIWLLGYSEWSAVLPSLVASLVILICVLYACYRFATVRHAWWAGMLIVVLPVEVAGSTIVSAHSVMAGLMAVGTLAFALSIDSRRARILASVCLSLGVLAHFNGVYYVAAVLAAGLLVDHRRFGRSVFMVCVAGVLFMAADMSVFHFAYGDALHRFRMSMPERVEPQADLLSRHLDLQSIVWSLQQLVISKPFGIALAIVWGGGFYRYRSLSGPLRIFLWGSLLFWLYLSFGSYVPWSYRPFYRNARYFHPLALPLAVLFSFVIVQIRGRWLRWAVGMAAPMSCILLLSLSGSWGQSVSTSRELAALAREHPELRFITDVHTLNEIYVLNGFKTPSNVWGTMDMGSEHFMDPQIRRLEVVDASNCDAILINPLNVERLPSFATIVRERAGTPVCSTAPAYRPICGMIPMLKRWDWSIRRPGARVHLLAGEPTNLVSEASGVAQGSARLVAP